MPFVFANAAAPSHATAHRSVAQATGAQVSSAAAPATVVVPPAAAAPPHPPATPATPSSPHTATTGGGGAAAASAHGIIPNGAGAHAHPTTPKHQTEDQIHNQQHPPKSDEPPRFPFPRPPSLPLPRLPLRLLPITPAAAAASAPPAPAPASPPPAGTATPHDDPTTTTPEAGDSQPQSSSCLRSPRSRPFQQIPYVIDPVALLRRHTPSSKSGSSTSSAFAPTSSQHNDPQSPTATSSSSSFSVSHLNDRSTAPPPIQTSPRSTTLDDPGLPQRTTLDPTSRVRPNHVGREDLHPPVESMDSGGSSLVLRRVRSLLKPNASEDNHTRTDILATTGREEELLVLVHGLQGVADDFNYFRDQLNGSGPAKEGKVLVYATDVNEDKTHDGIIEGGRRVADDILRVVAAHPTLRRISLVGFSLGGIYVRFAAGYLYDTTSGLIAGLQPQSVVAVASPNLGVRAFGVYRFIPQPMRSASKLLFGATGEQLLLVDDPKSPLLLHMTCDENPLGMPFMSALRSFPTRILYGNLRQDFMVNFGTSAIDTSVQVIGGNDLVEAVHERARRPGSTIIDRDFDERGCKVAFSYRLPLSSPMRSQSAGNVESKISEEILPDDTGIDNSGQSMDGEAWALEKTMARRLQDIGWKVVVIDFPISLPVAHNRIMAVSRNPIYTWLNASGQRAVLHLVDTLMAHYPNHEPVFRAVEFQDKPVGGILNVLF